MVLCTTKTLVYCRCNADQIEHEFINSKLHYTHLAVHLANLLLWPSSARTRTNRVQACLLIKLYNSWMSSQQLWISSSSTLNYTATSTYWKSAHRAHQSELCHGKAQNSELMGMRNYKKKISEFGQHVMQL